MNYVQYLSKHWKYCKFDATSEQRLLLSLERLASRKSNKAHLAKHKKLRHKGFLGINRPQLTTTWHYFRFIYKRLRSMARKAIIKNAPKCQMRLGRGGQYGYCPPKMGHFCNDRHFCNDGHFENLLDILLLGKILGLIDTSKTWTQLVNRVWKPLWASLQILHIFATKF